MRLVPIRCVRPNSYLGKTLYDSNGNRLLTSSAKLTDNILQHLKDLNIASLYIEDEYSNQEIQNVIKPEIREKSTKIIENSVPNIERLYHRRIKNRPFKEYIKYMDEKEKIIDDLNNTAKELVENILENNEILINLVDLKSMDYYTYQHSINVSIYSIIIGLGQELSKEELYNLALGALLHDIGKIFIPERILLKKGKLSPEESELIRTHPRNGYNYLSKFENIPEISKMIILHHHERLDGNGYPDGTSGNEINKLVNIVSIADVYDALTSKRPYREPMCPNDAFEYVFANSEKMFYFDLVFIFSKVIIPYPKGTIVKLNNGDIGIVQRSYSEYPLRPIIKILESNKKYRRGSIINLENSLSLVISNIEFNYV